MTPLERSVPVLVGSGQVNEREGGVEPVDLIAHAAKIAAQDAGSMRLLDRVDAVRVVGMLSWRYRDPGRLVAERLGASPRQTTYSGVGGSTPQVLVNEAAEDIAAGRADIVLVCGAEAWRTRSRLRAQGQRPAWTTQTEDVERAHQSVPDVPMDALSERRIGLDRPAYVYPLFEDALRSTAGHSAGEHEALIGRLWSSFSGVAALNPHAWVQRTYTADEIVTPSPDNRLISSPYTKLMNANNMVDQAACLILCSVETARTLSVPEDRWVYPQSGAESHDTYAIAERFALDRCPAIRIAGREALKLADVDPEQIAAVDIYSCFPSAVQIAAHELGFRRDGEQALTVTGGLTFAGGPWNNYSTHAIATMMDVLRRSPGARGLVTANSGYLTKHAVGVYSTEPPRDGFRRRNVQDQVDREPKVVAMDVYSGVAEAESWTVVYGRDGAPQKGFVAARTATRERVLAVTTTADDLDFMADTCCAGQSVRVFDDGTFEFSRQSG